MRVLMIGCSLVLAACSSQPTTDKSEPVPLTFTVHCQENWADCYTQARNRCDSGNFEELDRHASASLGTDMRTAVPTNLGREQARVNMVDRTVTIRCIEDR